jgi:hypothetical protein
MANPADQAAIEAAKANEAASLTYAHGMMGTAQESYGLFQQSAEQALAQRYVMYAKAGATSTGESALPSSGIPTGPLNSDEYLNKKKDIQSEIDNLNKDLDRAKKYGPNGGPVPVADIEEKLKEKTSALEALGTGGEALAEIRSNQGTKHLTGSDLLTELSYRDLAQRQGLTMFRTAEDQAVAAVTQGENFNKQASYLEDAKAWNTMSTILGAGLTVLGIALSVTGMPGLGVPLIAAGAGKTASSWGESVGSGPY